ncbi:hypothetical protein OKW29_000212 [Paraburkholderia sp. CI3]
MKKALANHCSQLIGRLRHGHSKRMSRKRGTDRRGRIPWQRGTCENTSGLLRQYLPKGTDLSVYAQDNLDAIADSLKSRPRATHAFHSPFELFERMLATASITSVSVH